MASTPMTNNHVDTQPIPPTDSSPHRFDISIVRDSFVNCIQKDNTLLLREYVRAYEELCIFVSSLGAVFEWAIKDLNNKLIILKEHQRLDPINYHSIQSMITYEVTTERVRTKETNIMLPTGKPLPNGCRTLLRLHRALGFISSFLSQMRRAPDDASSATIAWNAYSSTLGHFHSWPVRQTIHAAIRLTVPDRKTLVDRLLSNGSTEEIGALSDDIVQSCNTIESTTQELFEQHNLTKLP